jgi:hypothetical protein
VGEQLVGAVGTADLVFLDPDNGIQGTSSLPSTWRSPSSWRCGGRTARLFWRSAKPGAAPRSALSRGSFGRSAASGSRRFRLIASRFYVVTDHDEATAGRIAEFARKWGKWVEMYRF